MKQLAQFWADNQKIHGMYNRPAVVMPYSAVHYVGYALFCMLTLACNAGLVKSPWPSYIEKTNDPE